MTQQAVAAPPLKIYLSTVFRSSGFPSLLAQRLGSDGYDVYYREDLGGGDDLLPEQLTRWLADRDLFIGIYDAKVTDAMRFEYEEARRQGIPRLAILRQGMSVSVANELNRFLQRNFDERNKVLALETVPEDVETVLEEVRRFVANGRHFLLNADAESPAPPSNVVSTAEHSPSPTDEGELIRRKLEEVGRMMAERGERATVNVINEPDWSTRDLGPRLAFELRELGYLSAARAAYERVLREDPNDAEAAAALKEIERELGQGHEAEAPRPGTDSTEASPTAPAGTSAPAGGNAPGGSVAQVRPPAPDFTTDSAITERMREAARLAAAGEKEAAETLVSQLFTFAPDYESIHLGARVLRSEGYLEGALRAYEKLAELDPDNYPVGPINSIREELQRRAGAQAHKGEKTPADAETEQSKSSEASKSPEAEAARPREQQDLPLSEDFVRVIGLARLLTTNLLEFFWVDPDACWVGLLICGLEPSADAFVATFGLKRDDLIGALNVESGQGLALRNSVAEGPEAWQEEGSKLLRQIYTTAPEQGQDYTEEARSALARLREAARAQGAAQVTPRHLLEDLAFGGRDDGWAERTLGAREVDCLRDALKASGGRDVTREDFLRQAVRARLFKNPPAQSDSASVVDLLGFEEHAGALVDIIRKDETKPPLVVGVYGPWGSGKSTFMGLVKAKLEGAAERKRREEEQAEERERIGRLRFWWKGVRAQLGGVWAGLLTALRLKKRPAPRLKIVTVEYDAWAYADTPKLWSGLVGKVAKELDAELGWWGRISYLAERNSRRLLLALLLGFGPVLLFVVTRLGRYVVEFAAARHLGRLLPEFLSAAGAQVTAGAATDAAKLAGVAVSVAGFVATALLQRRPVTDAVTSLASRFDTTHAAGVISRIQDEFKTALQTRIAPDADDSEEKRKSSLRRRIENNELKIVVFIDELDRCPLERIVDILEAIKLFLAEDLFIVFLGVDTRVASEAIRLHYKEVRNPDLPREYLEKIVQLPLRVPTARAEWVGKYLRHFMAVPDDAAAKSAAELGAAAPAPQPGAGDKRVAEASPAASPAGAPAGVAQPPANGREKTSFEVLEQHGLTPRPAPDPLPVLGVRPPAGDQSASPGSRPPAPAALSALPALPDTRTEYAFMVELAEKFLESNPRRIKRLLNTYRYVKILSSVAGQPVEDDEWQKHMLAWLAFTMRWPSFMERAIEAAQARAAGLRRGESDGDEPPAAAAAAREKARAFLTELAREGGTPDEERPTEEVIEHHLPFDPEAVVRHYELAGNFLVENPRARASQEARKKNGGGSNETTAKRRKAAHAKRQPKPRRLP